MAMVKDGRNLEGEELRAYQEENARKLRCGYTDEDIRGDAPPEEPEKPQEPNNSFWQFLLAIINPWEEAKGIHMIRIMLLSPVILPYLIVQAIVEYAWDSAKAKIKEKSKSKN